MHGEKIPLRAQDFFQKSCARERSIKASRRDQIIISALTPGHRPRPGNRGGGSDQRERGRGFNFRARKKKTRADAPPRKQRSNAATTRHPRPRAPRTRARAQPPQGRGRGGRRAASEAPPGSQNTERRRHRAGRGAQRSEHRKPKSP